MQINNCQQQINIGKCALYFCKSHLDKIQVNPKVKLLQYGIDNYLKFDFFNEEGGHGEKRPVKNELLRKIRNGEYSEVVVINLNQWARNLQELIFEVKEFLENGIRFVSISDNVDFCSSADGIQYQVLDSLAKFDSKLKSSKKKE